MRGGKELPSSSALDSPSVLSKLATPKPASAINSDMLHVIDDATSAMHDTYDETTSMLDTITITTTVTVIAIAIKLSYYFATGHSAADI